MREITVKLYKFDELSEDAQDKAVERLADLNVDYDWWQFVYEDAERIGLKITSFDIDRHRHAKGNFTEGAEEVANLIMEEHGESCETYKTAKSYLEELAIERGKAEAEQGDDYDIDDVDTDEIDKEFLQSLLEDYAIMLEKEYEYQTSREAIVETIKANEYEFTEDGKLV